MTSIKKYTEDAKKVFDKIEYITLATVTKDGKPWNSPLWYVCDDKYNFYFYSPKYTQHAKNIRTSSEGFVTIYDSTAPEGSGFGVYLNAKVVELNSKKDIEEAIKWIMKKTNTQMAPEYFMGKSPRRIYKVIPKKVWVNDAEIKNGLYLDYRVDIKLS